MLLRGADHIVVVSDALGKDVLAIEPRVAEKMTTIYNGVDLAMFAPAENGLHPRPSDPNQSKPTILSIASFTVTKGHEVLVRAFARVLTTVPDACLVLVGADGPEAGATRELVDQLSLGKKVSIFKDVPHADIPTFLCRARLFVLASRAEGNPLALIEAGAARLPVVFTRTPASSELGADGVTVLLVEVNDEVSLAQAIIDLLVHTEVAQCMATKFHEHVRNNLSWSRTYETYLKLAANGMSHKISVAERK